VQEYSFATQAQIISALVALHNFIVVHDPSEVSPDEVETEANTDNPWSSYQATVPHEERTRATECRDHIAMAMWENYTTRLLRRRR